VVIILLFFEIGGFMMNMKYFLPLICMLFVTSTIPATGLIISPPEKMQITYNFFQEVLVRIDTTQADTFLPKGAEIIGYNPGHWVDIILPLSRLEELETRHIEYDILIKDVNSYSQQFRGIYHSLAEMETILNDIATNHPDITTLYSIGTTYENRDIWCLEITDNPGQHEEEPGVFLMGLHHAREWPSLEICLHIAQTLTESYGTDPDITTLIDNRRIWLVPCVNPDGYHWDHDLGHDWRKNRHYFPEFGTYGVDLNRNYAGSCNGVASGSWGSVGIASVTHNPGYETYCGPGPISELETQAVANVFLENDICAAISWHTYGELVMWPWGYTYSNAPDNAYLTQVGQEIASRITQQDGTGTYTPSQSSGLYLTTGDTTDWAYGYAHYVQGRATFAFTIEACSSFHPLAGFLDQVCSENLDGALYLLQEAETIKNIVPLSVLPPEIDEMTSDPDGNYVVSWQEQNPDAEPDLFQLDELSDLSLITDDTEAGADLWDLDGFSRSTSRYHSGSHSYKSSTQNSVTNTMTSVYPIPVSEGTMLSFWTWYDIENNWDFAMVEVSTDGRCYHVLDTFTGTSLGWKYQEYNLSNYAGKSLFLRFRYTTDELTVKEGFYIDDISPVADFATVVTLSDIITETSYDITDKPDGIYYYQVKGHNTERGWGDFSTLENIIVGEGDTEPPTVFITSPEKNEVYVSNKKLLPFFTTLIIGNIDIAVDAFDNTEVKQVEYYIDDQKVGTVTTEPYLWSWTQVAFFKHIIKVVAIDAFENQGEQELSVWKFF
jgi:hypothetical protein